MLLLGMHQICRSISTHQWRIQDFLKGFLLYCYAWSTREILEKHSYFKMGFPQILWKPVWISHCTCSSVQLMKVHGLNSIIVYFQFVIESSITIKYKLYHKREGSVALKFVGALRPRADCIMLP